MCPRGASAAGLEARARPLARPRKMRAGRARSVAAVAGSRQPPTGAAHRRGPDAYGVAALLASPAGGPAAAPRGATQTRRARSFPPCAS